MVSLTYFGQHALGEITAKQRKKELVRKMKSIG
jgi:hypothetical protein